MNNNKTLPAVALLLDDNRGTYIPKNFVEDFTMAEWGLDPESWEVMTCQDRDSEGYWDAWDVILNNAKYHDPTDGSVHTLYQEGALWAICIDKMTNEEKRNFGFDVEADTCCSCGGYMEAVTESCIPLSPQWDEHQNICEGCFESIKSSNDFTYAQNVHFEHKNKVEFSTIECDECGTTLGGERNVVGYPVWKKLVDEDGTYNKGRLNRYGIHYGIACIDCTDEMLDT